MKTILFVLSLFICANAITVIDSFNRANGPLRTGSWYKPGALSSVEIVNNKVALTAGSFTNAISIWTADSFGANKFVEVKIDTIFTSTGNNAALYINSDTARTGYYRALIYYDQIRLYRTTSLLTTITMAISAGNVVRLYSIGDSVCVNVNNVKVGGVTDATYRGTHVGIGIYYETLPSFRIDDFMAGDYPVGGTPIDSIVSCQFFDSTSTKLMARTIVGRDGADTIVVLWGTDSAATDTIRHVGIFNQNDSIFDTLTNLEPSTKYYVAAIDSQYKTGFDSSYTKDSVDTITIDIPASVTVQPESHSIVYGGSWEIHASYTGDTPLTYQWQRNGVNLSNGTNVTGATAQSLLISNVTTTGTYRVIVANITGSDTSSNAVISVGSGGKSLLQRIGNYIGIGL